MARSKSVLLRLTEEEYARLKELAGREPVNAYLRRMALGEQPATPALDREKVREVIDDAARSGGGMAVVPTTSPKPVEAVPGPHRWFCSTCNTISRVPRCASNPSHKVTPA